MHQWAKPGQPYTPHLAREIERRRGRRIISDGQVRESIRWACICPRHHHCCCGRLNNYCGPTKEESSLPTRLDRPAHHLPGGLLSLSLYNFTIWLCEFATFFSYTSTRTNTAIRYFFSWSWWGTENGDAVDLSRAFCFGQLDGALSYSSLRAQ
jgi:hypothetical protein